VPRRIRGEQLERLAGGYRHAIDEFVDWYCSEPRLAFSKTVVVRYRMHLETRHLAPGTINLRLGAVSNVEFIAVRSVKKAA
jgi:hypothetical protein